MAEGGEVGRGGKEEGEHRGQEGIGRGGEPVMKDRWNNGWGGGGEGK